MNVTPTHINSARAAFQQSVSELSGVCLNSLLKGVATVDGMAAEEIRAYLKETNPYALTIPAAHFGMRESPEKYPVFSLLTYEQGIRAIETALREEGYTKTGRFYHHSIRAGGHRP